MSIIPGDNPVCCTLVPKVTDANYKPRGETEYINGTATYVIGEKSSKKAIVVAMDAFGMAPLTQQGCDVLASYGFYVLMPDLLGDQVVRPEDLGFDTPEKQEKRRRWFASAGNPQGRLAEFVGYGEYLRCKGFVVGSLGFCWGAKLVLLASREPAPYSAIAAVHPTLLKPEDAALCKVPLGLYPSKDEDPTIMESFVKVARDYKLYAEAFHGFAAARADLENPIYKEAYEDVYGRLAAFFNQHLESSKL
ncbi:putative AIM2 family protein C30D10,14 [Schizosaccharomyces pombe 972h-] [Rhizoctonia solani]|uniref:Putative AIM2 family protein C30D10,14 [Schizosaccharomyces pombe 972h-] n=1 Tax=Rhizoctonia solani TaxID=456999 RepID=A0A0K6G643_9AGAM|nr:putative AIM2 family protein C30D10,14 [Schizosaccharomyces pombe 972h-] [Rhizoctonia solani]